jgi:hypothetical protein
VFYRTDLTISYAAIRSSSLRRAALCDLAHANASPGVFDGRRLFNNIIVLSD